MWLYWTSKKTILVMFYNVNTYVFHRYNALAEEAHERSDSDSSSDDESDDDCCIM